MPSTLGAGDTSVDNTDTNPCPPGALRGRRWEAGKFYVDEMNVEETGKVGGSAGWGLMLKFSMGGQGG